jgi:glycosyltransferase involved in cell wall biosynthesis
VNILLAISDAPPRQSGMARVAANLRKGFIEAGHSVSILSTEDAGRFTVGELRLTGLSLRWRRLRKHLVNADIVSVHGPAPTFSDALLLLLWLRKRRGTNVVYTHHFDIDLPHLGPVCATYNWVHRRLARLADRIVVTTPSYASLFGSRPDRVTVIPWGADNLLTRAASKAQPFTVLFVGQLRPYKGVSTLLSAARYAPDARILIAGDGPQRARLERQAASLATHNVQFLGAVSDAQLAALYSEAHAVVLPSVSHMEAFGITLLEGMRDGCVPVASALPGVTEVVGDAGLTFPPGDAAALGHILATLSSDEAERRERAERSLARSRQFSWERTVHEYLQLYQSLLEGHPARARASDLFQPVLRGRP